MSAEERSIDRYDSPPSRGRTRGRSRGTRYTSYRGRGARRGRGRGSRGGRSRSRGRGRARSRGRGRGRDRGGRSRGRGRGRDRGTRYMSYRGRGRGRGVRGVRGRGRSRGSRYTSYRGRGRGRMRGGRRSRMRGPPLRDYDRARIKPSTLTTDNKQSESIGMATTELLSKQEWRPDEKQMDEIKTKFSALNTESIQQILLGQHKSITTVQQHIYCIRYNKEKYISHIEAFIKFKVFATLTISSKAKILVALITCKQMDIVHKVLYTLDNETKIKKANISYYSVPEIAKVVQLLDAPRLARQKLKEIQKLENPDTLEKKKKNKNKNKNKNKQKRHDPAKKRKKLLMLKQKVYNLQKDGESLHCGSLSGAKQKFFAKWIGSIDSNVLSFFLLNFPKTNWRFICDLIHTNPEKDFPKKMGFFQNFMFNENSDEKKDEDLMDKDSLVYNAKRVNQENLVELLTKYSYLCQCYSYIRTRILVSAEDTLPDAAKLILSQHAPLPDLLWWYDEFEMPQVENKICERLSANKDKLIFIDDGSNKSNYGKLMERLLKFLQERRKFAPLLIQHVQLKLYSIPRIVDIFREKKSEFRVAIFGDASASMNVAIRTASILSSLMSYALCADLLFFNSEPFDPPVVPRDVRETIEVVTKVKGNGTTSMASALYPYYINKIKVDLFILVSDEGENRRYKGYYFAQLFDLYKKEINDQCKLFLVSFLHQNINGLIMNRCKAIKSIADGDIKQIRLHPLKPDTSKFDGLLGVAALMLSSIAIDSGTDQQLPYIQQSIFNALLVMDILAFHNAGLCQHISELIYDFLRGLPNKSVLSLGGGFATSLDAAMKNKKDVNMSDTQELDLVFCMDCTGSMGSYIEKGKEAITSIVSEIEENKNVDVQFGYIAYRDHPPQDDTFIYQIHPFTKLKKEMISYINKYGADGGGDGPEAVTSGLNAAINDASENKLVWRACSVRIVVLIADAPPHGLGAVGADDGFPDGSPDGLDPIKVARNLAENGIVLYVVACESGLSTFQRAHDLMAGLAKITEGSFLPLTSAKLLPDIIVGGAKQEISLQKLTRQIQQEYNENIKKKFNNLIVENNWTEIYEQISIALNLKNITYSKFEIDDIYGDYNPINIDKCVYCESLEEWRTEYDGSIQQPNVDFNNIQEQTAKSQESQITPEIVKTVMNRLLNQW